MDVHSAAEVLLVRSVEETAPELIPGEAFLDATLAAGAVEDPSAWLARRAHGLAARLPPACRSLPAMTDALARGGLLFFGAAFLAGLLTNYLGPGQQIHAFYNPITLLVLWNLGVFAVLAVRSRLWPRAPFRPSVSFPRGAPGAPAARGRASLAAWLLRRVLPPLWLRLQKSASATREEARALRAVAAAFWRHWTRMVSPLVDLTARRLLDQAAIGIALGAVAGMFVRGLFLDYQVVWRSTFITRPEDAAALLAAVYALPCLLLSEPLPDAALVRELMQPSGVPAAPWIRLYAAAAALYIVVPRCALALARALRLRRRGASLELALDEPYYRDVLEKARSQRIGEIATAIRADVAAETGRFAADVAAFVCRSLYDERIAARLRRFREQGGRLRDLEGDVEAACREFEPELEAYFPEARAGFERRLARAVARTVDDEVSFRPSTAGGLHAEVAQASSLAASGTGRSIGAGLERLLGSAVSSSVAVVVGTVSGGFGKSLGVAIVATLLHTTGPLGFLIGALAGLGAAGAAWLAGRRHAAGAIRSLDLPARAVRVLIGAGRLERLLASGRAQCQRAVEALVRERLEPLTPEISDQIWTQVKPVLAERQRAAR
jgi:hypothetical protein